MEEGTFPCRVISKDPFSITADVHIGSGFYEDREFPLDVVKGVIDLTVGTYFTLTVDKKPGELSFRFSYGVTDEQKKKFEDTSRFDDLNTQEDSLKPSNF